MPRGSPETSSKRPLVNRTLAVRANAASENAPATHGYGSNATFFNSKGQRVPTKGNAEYEQPHAAAGEAHLLAAKYADREGGWQGKWNADRHRAAAAVHAQEAGGAWDESKHPRDDHGKFS